MSDVTRVPDICQSVCNQCVICDRISGARMCSKLNAKEIPRQCWSLFLWAPSAQLWCAPTSCTNVAMVLHIDLCWNTEISENALHITSCNSMSNSVQQCPTVSNLCAFFTRFSAFSSTLQSTQIRKEGCNPSSQLSSPQPRMSESLPKSCAHLCVPSPSEWFVCPFSLHLVPSESLRSPFCRHLPGLLHGSGKENLLIAA